MNNQLIVSSSPHIRSSQTVRNLYTDFLISLIPCVIAGTILFGYRAFVLVAFTACVSIIFHRIWCLFARQSYSVDLKLIISSVVFALMLPVTAPLYVPLAGSLILTFGFMTVNLRFGKNFVNPVVAARIIVQLLWQSKLTLFVAPFTKLALFNNDITKTVASPVALMYGGNAANIEMPSRLAMYFGNTAGHIGETCVFAVLIGLVYLIVREIIHWEIPLIYLLSVAVFSNLFGVGVLYPLLAGGIAFAAVYIATDFESSPITHRGRIIYGILLGLLTVAARFTILSANSFLFAILIMSFVTPFIDRLTPARVFGRRTTKVLFSFNALKKRVTGMFRKSKPSQAINEKATEMLVAKVMCNGFRGMSKVKYQYSGVEECMAVSNLADGPKACTYGCIGYGTCVSSCDVGAISIVNELAVIDADLCTGCGNCLDSCPKQVIKMMPKTANVFILCSSCDEAEASCENCEMSCNGCGECAVVCPKNAISIRNDHAVINYRKCDACGACISACPRKIILMKM